MIYLVHLHSVVDASSLEIWQQKQLQSHIAFHLILDDQRGQVLNKLCQYPPVQNLYYPMKILLLEFSILPLLHYLCFDLRLLHVPQPLLKPVLFLTRHLLCLQLEVRSLIDR